MVGVSWSGIRVAGLFLHSYPPDTNIKNGRKSVNHTSS